MTLLTVGGTLVSWDPSPSDKTDMPRSTSHKPSSTPAIQIIFVSCCTLCPRLDGPSDHVNERAILSGTTVVTLSNCICKGSCPPLCVYRPRFQLCSDTINPSFSDRTVSRSYSCLLPNLLCPVFYSRSITSDCSSFYHFVEPIGCPTAGIWLSDTSSPRSIARSLSLEHEHRPST